MILQIQDPRVMPEITKLGQRLYADILNLKNKSRNQFFKLKLNLQEKYFYFYYATSPMQIRKRITLVSY